MSVQPQDQVKWFDFLFGMSWKDPASDRRALSIEPGETLITVTSGGCNTLTLFLKHPAKICAVDNNPTQSYLLELKRAAIRRFDGEELRAFLGLTSSDKRMHNFDRLRGNLSKAALRYWVSKPHMLRHGVMNAGRYESFIPLFSRAVGIVQGKKRVEGLFLCEALEKQQADFDSRWSTVRWRLLFKLDRS